MNEKPDLTDGIFVFMMIMSVFIAPLLILSGPPGWFLLIIWFGIVAVCVPDRLSFWLGERAKERRGGKPSKLQLWEEQQREERKHWH